MSWSLENDAEGREKFVFLVHMSSAIELAQESYCKKSLLFEPKALSLDQINLGYEANEAYRWLRVHGSTDGEYEAQTVLMVQDEKVRKVIQRNQAGYLAGQDEAMEVLDETQIVEAGWTEPGRCKGTEA